MTIKDRIDSKISDLMSDPETAPPLSTGGLLQGGARLFGHLIRLRARCYETGLFKIHRLPCTVVSIGNITSGGTGKTPMTLYVAMLLQRFGFRVAVLSRGYKGAAEKKGGIVSDGQNILMPPESAGDEPYMMAGFLKDIPVLVGKNRVASGRLAIARFSPDVLLLDDGFQHRRLHRDIDIVLLDSARPFGNRFLLPRGSLREAPEALARASAIVFTRWHKGLKEPSLLLPESIRTRPIFKSRHIPYIHHSIPSAAGFHQTSVTHDPSRLKGARVFAFSAIADNKDFHHVLANLGCQTVGTSEFADHHAYLPRELEEIGRKAMEVKAAFLATTQKDFSKIPKNTTWPLPLVVLGVLPSFMEEHSFSDYLKKAVDNAIARLSK